MTTPGCGLRLFRVPSDRSRPLPQAAQAERVVRFRGARRRIVSLLTCVHFAPSFELDEKLTRTMSSFISPPIVQSRRPAYSPTISTSRFPRIVPPVFSLLPGSAFAPVTESFAARLRRLRDEQGLSMVALASAVGASEGAIRQLESGRVKTPNFLLGLRLAEFFNVDPRYLALGDGVNLSQRVDSLERRVSKLEQRAASAPATRR